MPQVAVTAAITDMLKDIDTRLERYKAMEQTRSWKNSQEERAVGYSIHELMRMRMNALTALFEAGEDSIQIQEVPTVTPQPDDSKQLAALKRIALSGDTASRKIALEALGVLLAGTTH
jgi:hypothetical protein